MLKSLSKMQRHETKQSINSLFGLTRSSALPMPWKSHYVHGTSDVIGKMPQLTTHHMVFCGEMETVSIQPTLKHKYQLNNKILMEELLHNRNDITEPRKYV